jgi:predicted acetylornithine/succinylornithine family transaminase
MAISLSSATPVDIDAVDAPAGPGNATAPSAGADALLGLYRRAPMEFVRGQGVELFDADGRAYLDLVSGIAVNALGYGDPGLMNVMREATESALVHTSNLYRTAPGERLARWLVAHSFADRVFFCNSGAEANEGAFKFARRWARGLAGAEADVAGGAAAKHEIVSLRGAFHGRLFASLALTDRPNYRAPFRPLAGGATIAERDIQELGAVLDADTTAAVIVEPVQGESGVRVLDAGFLRELRAMTAERHIALIFDEIQCGLGRLGHLFAYERVNVVPDMVTLAKPLAGGLPMGAVLMTEPIASAMKPGDHGTTFGGGPFVASVAEYVVQRLADPALLAHVRENGQWLGGELEAMGERTGRVRAVRGVGYMWGVDTHEPAAAIVARALDLGLLLVTAGEHTLRLLPPLVATRDDLARGVALLEQAIGNGGGL